MAQKSNKSRIVIWTIVGILVVVAVILLVTRPKNVPGARDISTEDIPGYVTRYQSHLEKFDRRVENAIEDYGEGEVFGEIDMKVQYIRAGLSELEGLTEPDEIKAKMDSIDLYYKDARQLLSDYKKGE